MAGAPDFKMTDEQKEMFDGLTRLQQEISLNSIAGMSDADAYRNSSGKATTESSMRATVSEILANPNVKNFIDSMVQSSVNDAVMSRQEMLEMLTDLARTNLSDLVEFGYRPVHVINPETGEEEIENQSYWTLKESSAIDPKHMKSIEEVTSGKSGLTFKKVSRLAAAKQLADMQGYNETQKIEHTIINKADEADW